MDIFLHEARHRIDRCQYAFKTDPHFALKFDPPDHGFSVSFTGINILKSDGRTGHWNAFCVKDGAATAKRLVLYTKRFLMHAVMGVDFLQMGSAVF